ncbi:transposase [Cerasicoccus maritimus]|uniref:transposase n=1 Tax=Cerasicoccus maritimus TaxID=490089 RepID=UPI003CCD7730
MIDQKQYLAVKLGIDVHADSYVVVRQVDGSTPQTSQKFRTRESFLRFVSKQQSEAEQVYACYEAGPFGYRLLLSGLAYTLMEGLRRLALKDTELARAQANTIRSRLIKIGAVITRNTRRIRIHLSEAHPLKELFAQAVNRLVST